MEQGLCSVRIYAVEHVLEHGKALLFVFDERIFLSVTDKADALLYLVDRGEVVLPLRVDNVEHDVSLICPKAFVTGYLFLSGIYRRSLFPYGFLYLNRIHTLKIDIGVFGRIECVNAFDLSGVGLDLPFVRPGLKRKKARRKVMQQVLRHAVLAEQVFAVLRFEHQLAAEAVDGFALFVHHVIVFKNVFACLEVAGLDGLLRSFDLLRNCPRFDSDTLFHSEPFHHRTDLVTGKDTHQVVFQRQNEAG